MTGMPNHVNGNVLVTSRGVKYDIFDKNDKFSRIYKNKLSTNTKSFLNKANNANASREDVTNYLQNRGFINGTLRNNPHFVQFINSTVPEDRIGLVLPEREKAMRYLRDVIRVDPKLFGKRISRDDILEILRENKKLQNGARLSKKLEDAIKAIIGRHNASFTKQNINKYRKGKNTYSLTFKAVVWNEQLEHEYVDDVTIGFYSDLTYEQMTKEIIEEIVEIYYADRDYPDFIRLLDYVLTLIAKDKNILEMKLLDVICGKKYRSNYIRSYKDLVEGYDEKEHDGKCLNIMLQTNYKPLVDQRLIPR